MSIETSNSIYSKGCDLVTLDIPDTELKRILRLKRKDLFSLLWLSREMDAETAFVVVL